MAERKNAFILYKDLLPQFELLTDEQAGQLIKIILTYVNDLQIPELTGEVKIAFSFIKTILKRDLQKYESIVTRNQENGKMGGRPLKETNLENPVGYLGNPEKPKKADSVSVSDSDTDSDIKPKAKTLDNIFNDMIVAYTNKPELQKSLHEFVKFRKTTKPAMTELAFTKSLNTLDKLFATDDLQKIQAIDQSIENGWKGIFAVNGKADNKASYAWQGELKAEQDAADSKVYEPKRNAEELKRKFEDL